MSSKRPQFFLCHCLLNRWRYLVESLFAYKCAAPVTFFFIWSEALCTSYRGSDRWAFFPSIRTYILSVFIWSFRRKVLALEPGRHFYLIFFFRLRPWLHPISYVVLITINSFEKSNERSVKKISWSMRGPNQSVPIKPFGIAADFVRKM